VAFVIFDENAGGLKLGRFLLGIGKGGKEDSNGKQQGWKDESIHIFFGFGFFVWVKGKSYLLGVALCLWA
tara:strand:+ start:346 stop:555 length:210 start_codon:yes stop_codon:yes gene_type:complete